MNAINYIITILVIIFMSSCSDHNNYMPITKNNLVSYVKRSNEMSMSVAIGVDNMTKNIALYKTPIEDMGYDFDATLLNFIQVQTQSNRSDPYG